MEQDRRPLVVLKMSNGVIWARPGVGAITFLLFRWFKFTLKPPYSIARQITIGHLGHFLLDFLAQIWTQGTLRHILGPILVIFEICQFLKIPGLFEYFSENGWSQKIKVF